MINKQNLLEWCLSRDDDSGRVCLQPAGSRQDRSRLPERTTLCEWEIEEIGKDRIARKKLYRLFPENGGSTFGKIHAEAVSHACYTHANGTTPSLLEYIEEKTTTDFKAVRKTGAVMASAMERWLKTRFNTKGEISWFWHVDNDDEQNRSTAARFVKSPISCISDFSMSELYASILWTTASVPAGRADWISASVIPVALPALMTVSMACSLEASGALCIGVTEVCPALGADSASPSATNLSTSSLEKKIVRV